MLNPSMLGSQHSNLNQQSLQQQHNSNHNSSNNNNNGRPTQARSPYEWMKKPSYSSVTSNSGGESQYITFYLISSTMHNS